MKIGDKEINTRAIMAPMSGCTDLPFRLIAREQGAELCYFEMLDANALIYKPSEEDEYLRTIAKDAPIAAQLVGGEKESLIKAARKLLTIIKPLYLELNAACPVRKILKKKGGAYLLHDQKRLFQLIEALVKEFDLPVTVKLRTGFKATAREKIVKLARGLEKRGAAALFVHGRTREQGYSGEIDYGAIAAIKEAVGIPVIGSGNIFDPGLANKMLEQTGCDGILVARGALGNPWIFQSLKGGQNLPEIKLDEKIRVLKKHLKYIIKYKKVGQNSKLGIMKRVSMWYLKGLWQAAKLREAITSQKSVEQLFALIDGLLRSPATGS